MAPQDAPNPDAFDDDEAALARFRAARDRLLHTPPRCLAGFHAQPTSPAPAGINPVCSDLTKFYKLSCPCGHDRFLILGHPFRNDRGDPIFVSPLALRCAACQTVTELIDTARHGYDAELGLPTATIRGHGPRSPYACDTCGIRPMAAHVRLVHSGEELADSFLEDFPNPQDYFGSFSLVGTCAGCNRQLSVADFECA